MGVKVLKGVMPNQSNTDFYFLDPDKCYKYNDIYDYKNGYGYYYGVVYGDGYGDGKGYGNSYGDGDGSSYFQDF